MRISLYSITCSQTCDRFRCEFARSDPPLYSYQEYSGGIFLPSVLYDSTTVVGRKGIASLQWIGNGGLFVVLQVCFNQLQLFPLPYFRFGQLLFQQGDPQGELLVFLYQAILFCLCGL